MSDPLEEAIDALKAGNPAPGRRLLLAKKWTAEREPQLLQRWVRLALSLSEDQDAEAILQHWVDQHPDQWEARVGLGNFLRTHHKNDEALTHLEIAYRESKGDAEVVKSYFLALERASKFTEAQQLMQELLRQLPGEPEALGLLADTFAHLGQPAQSINHYMAAIQSNPEDFTLHYRLAQALLQMGEWKEGWRLYDYRLALRDQDQLPQTKAQRWRKGEPLTGKSILIWQEQGFGDVIQFLRFIPVIQTMAKSVFLLVNRHLASLVSYNFPEVQIIYTHEPVPSTDYHLPIMSLADRLEVYPMDILTGEPYLRAPKAAHILANDKTKVGLVWAGNPNHPDDHRRSVLAAVFQPLLDLPFLSLYSFQVGRHEWAAHQPNVHDLMPRLHTFMDTAQFLQEMDLVISVDTAVGHLAGALGIPVHLLLDIAPDWRWGTKGRGTVWYEHHTLWRQEAAGQWNPIIRRLVRQLTA